MHPVYNAAKRTEEASTSWSASTTSSGHPESIVFVQKSGVVAWKKWCLSGFNLPVQLLPLLKYFTLLQCCSLREKHLCRTCSRSSQHNKRPLLARDEKQKLAWVCRCMLHFQNQNEVNWIVRSLPLSPGIWRFFFFPAKLGDVVGRWTSV